MRCLFPLMLTASRAPWQPCPRDRGGSKASPGAHGPAGPPAQPSHWESAQGTRAPRLRRKTRGAR